MRFITGQTQKFLGVPKTIDNDLALTDHTPGFGSAAKYIGASTKEVIRDAEGLTYKKKYDHHYGDHGKKCGLAYRRHCTFQSQKTAKDQILFTFRRFPLTLRNSSQK